MTTPLLQWPDYLVLASFLVISLGIGLYHSLTGNRQRTTADFIMADRKLRVLPTSISLLVSFQSAIMILGFSAEMYCYGIQFFVFYSISLPTALLIVERIFVPWLFRLKLVSIYEYLDLRFSSKSVRVFGASMGVMGGIMYMGVAMYAPAAAMEAAAGMPLKITIPIMALVSIAYTSLGGMRAVIWTDVFQFVTMVAGMLAVLIKGLVVVGGFSNVLSLAGQEGRLQIANFSPDPRERHTVWGLTIGFLVGWVNMYGLSQASVQRFSAIDKLSNARLTVLLNVPAVFVMALMASVMGMTVLAYFATVQCDPLANNDVTGPNQLLPFFVITMFSGSPGFTGLFLATLYGGSLSSVSSSLSGSAANCWEDILKWRFSHIAESRKALVNRFLVVLFGLMATGIAFLAATVPGPITQVTSALCNSFSGPLMGLFVLGGISRHANWKGSLIGGSCGLFACLWLSIGSITLRSKHPPLPPVSIEGCYADSGGNWTLYASNHTYLPDLINSTQLWRYTNGSNAQNSFNQASPEFHGLENFYAVSYLWFAVFGLTVTFITGSIASIFTKVKGEESKIEDRLLIRPSLKDCGCHGDNSTESNNHFELNNHNNNLQKLDLNVQEEANESLMSNQKEKT